MMDHDRSAGGGTARFAFSGAGDVAALARRYRERGHVRIAGFLPNDTANALRTELLNSDRWTQVFNMGDRLYELDGVARAALTPAEWGELDRSIMANARTGFQFRYETIRVPDGRFARERDGSLLGRFARWLATPDMLDRFSTFTGLADLRFADVQATRYRPGDLLTGHDDAIKGKHRRAAYVLGLTPHWRLEWGGALMFNRGADAADAWMPGFNCIDIFAVPQMHSVSYVTEAAAFPRLSVTGWLRAEYPPA
ncbi:2OG-Fe(II) oxygenase family protein [Sphingomonas sp.]|uniref:2OG-Fe(II) oxygenase n=1 Tax=Sphingomonas sp. TaxID=28214 RepID=UPI0025FD3F0D|nr:2OG-Fe(II) oxygenase family protein [Sphingomonas sp.]